MQNLPCEIIQHICSFMEIKDVCALSDVNKRLRESISYNNVIWARQLEKRYDVPPSVCFAFAALETDVPLKRAALETEKMFGKNNKSMVVDMTSNVQSRIMRDLVPAHRVKSLFLKGNTMRSYPWVDIRKFTFLKELSIDGGHDTSGTLPSANPFPNLPNLRRLFVDFRSSACYNSTLLQRFMPRLMRHAHSIETVAFRNFFRKSTSSRRPNVFSNDIHLRKMRVLLLAMLRNNPPVNLRCFEFVGPHAEDISRSLMSTLQLHCPLISKIHFDNALFFDDKACTRREPIEIGSAWRNNIDAVSCVSRCPPSYHSPGATDQVASLSFSMMQARQTASQFIVAPSQLAVGAIENPAILRSLFEEIVRSSTFKVVFFASSHNEYAVPPEWRCFWLARLLRRIVEPPTNSGTREGRIEWAGNDHAYRRLMAVWSPHYIRLLVAPSKEGRFVPLARIIRRKKTIEKETHICAADCPANCGVHLNECFCVASACAEVAMK
jgi:hypothetical protein